jgi:excisionase family DNA binding protein
MPSNPEWTGPVGRLWDFTAIRADGGPARSTIYLMIEAGELEAVKMGNKLRITDRSYQAWKETLLRGVGASPFAA